MKGNVDVKGFVRICKDLRGNICISWPTARYADWIRA